MLLAAAGIPINRTYVHLSKYNLTSKRNNFKNIQSKYNKGSLTGHKNRALKIPHEISQGLFCSLLKAAPAKKSGCSCGAVHLFTTRRH